MNILLTGANGFLGKKIYTLLKLKNHKIDSVNLRKAKNIKIFLNDISSKNYDYIINCAASIKPKNEQEKYINEIFPFDIQQKVLNKKTILIHISTLNVLNENLKDLYSLGKFNAEKKLIKKNLIIIRPNLIIDDNFAISRKEFEKYIKLPFRFLPMIYPGNLYSPINVNKLSEFIIGLIEKNFSTPKIYNIHGNKDYNLWQIFDNFCKTKNKKAIKIDIRLIDKLLPNFIKSKFKKKQYASKFFKN